MLLFLAHMTDRPPAPPPLPNRLQARFVATYGRAMEARVERMSDGFGYDFAAGAFVAAPEHPWCPAWERIPGLYAVDLGPDEAFPAGSYCVTLHDPWSGCRAIDRDVVTLAPVASAGG